jgi:hypothetical protein
MKIRHLAILFVVVLSLVCACTNVEAATVTMSIDGDSTSAPLEMVAKPGGGNMFFIGTEEDGFTLQTANGELTLFGALDPDPSIVFGGVALDIGAPSVFGMTIILPLSPTIKGASKVLDSFAGSVTNGPNPQADGGVTVTALPPLAAIPVDGDGMTEMQVFTLSDDGGATWKNVGLDLGLTEFVALGGSQSGATTAYNEGYIPTIAGGPWTHMRADITFGLSGFGDVFTFNGAKVLIPEPGTATLGLLALVFLGAWRRPAVR